MKKLIKIAVVAALILSVGGTVLSSALLRTLDRTITAYERSNLRETLRLQDRITELEAAVRKGVSAVADVAIEVLAPTQAPETEEPTQPEVPTEETVAQSQVVCTEVHAPDALPDAEESYLYTISTHEGIIGVFDRDGRLLRTVNVCVDILPQVDRKALAEGIHADSHEAMLQIIAQYE